ncbi:MAG TPA: type IV toxin-antitoxin system AbiEi family antitoxin domain-containing protein [Nocardioidaceae bacterium]|nr:type IV toxin-antitoxin system AbiEi family antitoxin domain-containing protein [Nocardioidaceae bacterium]
MDESVLAESCWTGEAHEVQRDIDSLLASQAGVVARRQLLALGLHDHDLARLVRRKDLVRLLPGVYVDHTGEPTWLQRAWAGVLLAWPAALAGQSALRAADGPGSPHPGGPIHVAVRPDRHVHAPAEVSVHRILHGDGQVLWNLGPPRMRYEEATVDVADAATSEFDAIGQLGHACQSRRTTAARMLALVGSRSRLRRRDFLAAVLADVAEGACSVLEHGYLTRVERPHGLSGARRQVCSRVGPGVVYRDVEYLCGLIAEMDGRLFHDSTEQRDRDFDRDLDAAVDGRDSVRLSWGQVFDRPCRTAGKMGRLLTMRGWAGAVRPCGPDCRLGT